MRSQKVCKCIIILVASLCCIYQLHNTLYNYFRYTTMSRIELAEAEILQLMWVSLCLPYLTFLDVKFVKKKFDIDLTNLQNLLDVSEHNDYERYRDIVEDKITIRELLEYTRSTKDIIRSCSMRFKSSRYFTYSNDTELCKEFFKIQKYFTQDFICYLFIPKQIKIPTTNYYYANKFSGVKYSVGLQDSFAQYIRYYKFVVHSDGFPFRSKNFAEVRRTNDPTRKRHNIKFVRYWRKYLGYPYSLFTCTNDKKALPNCREYCIMNQTIRRYGRVIYDLDTDVPYDYPAITRIQTEDEILSSELDNIFSKCIKSCKEHYCLFDYTITTYDNDNSSHASMYLKTPSAPDTISITLPMLNLLDLFVYVMGALGSWFGFAFIHIDSIPILKPRKLGGSKQVYDYAGNKLSPEKLFAKRHARLYPLHINRSNIYPRAGESMR